MRALVGAKIDQIDALEQIEAFHGALGSGFAKTTPKSETRTSSRGPRDEVLVSDFYFRG
jgi:hypothetical protein